VKLVLQEENLDISQLLNTVVKPKVEKEGSSSKKNDLDAPLESAGSTMQIDAGNGSVSEMWKGTTAQQVVEHFGLDRNSDNMLGAIQNLFVAISCQKKQTGVIGPRQFITKLKQENGYPLLIRNL
jgi:tellurite resistance protein